MYRLKEGISGFGWTDGQPENVMPLAPKGGGIQIIDRVLDNRKSHQNNYFCGKFVQNSSNLAKILLWDLKNSPIRAQSAENIPLATETP